MAKKDFTAMNNPAGAVLSTLLGQEDKPKGGRPVSTGETRSRRTNVLFTPSMFNDLKDLAAMKRTSLNNLLNELAEQAIVENKEALDQFRDIHANL